VAKDVETQAQRQFLMEAGCRVCQGDLFVPARAAHEIEPLLRKRRAGPPPSWERLLQAFPSLRRAAPA
jgi:sensor c-di-GMP phosphodiesterase-like protein